MQLNHQQLKKAGNDMFSAFVAEVKTNDLVTQCREDYYEQAGNVRFPTVSREKQGYLDCNIYFEILCYGAFCLSIAAVPHCVQKRFFSQGFDRSSWASIHEGISDALYAEIARLDATFPGQAHAGAVATPVEAAKLAFIGYMQHFTDHQAGADLLALHQRAKSPTSLGCDLFSVRMSLGIDPNLGGTWGAFKTQWIPFAQQIVTETAQAAKSAIR